MFNPPTEVLTQVGTKPTLMSTIIPKLGLDDIRDGNLVAYAQDKVAKIKASSAFGGLSPSTGEVEVKITFYEVALVAADEGTKAETEAKNDARKALEDLLTLQAQNCAEIAAGDLALYLSTGYEAKDVTPPPVGELERPDMHKVEPTDNIGELKADWSSVEHAQNYSVRAYTDPADPEGSKVYEEIAGPSKATLNGLPSGAQVYVYARANGGSTGHSPWSEAIWARPR